MYAKLGLSLLAVSLTAVLAVPVDTVQAHGGEGLTFTSTTTGGRIVDVDYPESSIEAGTIGRFDFGLFADATRQKQTIFTDIWIRITEKDGSEAGKTLFAGSVAKQEFGGNGFSYVFPEGGTYTLSLRYNDTGKGDFGETVGEAEFELNVLRSPDENIFTLRMEFWVGLLVGLFGATIAILPLLLRSKKS
ncbi:hypothetical protein EXS56_01450 [Candidatus Kaiserbacteria bacterium]|nr:hypothetical protein [Candidatus Kaiserbacteria bacterium]